MPTALTQYQSDGVTGITVGDTITENTVVMKGGVSDPSGNKVKLDVEVKPVEIPFTNTPTISSGLLDSGSTASVTVSELANGQYKWQARATNSQGVSGPWQAAGGNDIDAIDFIVSALDLPTALTQYKSDRVTGITVGDTTTENTVIMTGGVSDPRENMVKLDVEVKPVEIPFTNTPTISSELVLSGSTASVTVSGLANGQYKWQARATNSQGVSGSWQAAGGNADTSPDFIVSVAAPTLTINPDSGQQGTTFTFSGNGYTPNGAIEWHVKQPDNTELPVSTSTADGSGTLSFTYVSKTTDMVGTYTIYGIDSATGRQSNSVQETIT